MKPILAFVFALAVAVTPAGQAGRPDPLLDLKARLEATLAKAHVHTRVKLEDKGLRAEYQTVQFEVKVRFPKKNGPRTRLRIGPLDDGLIISTSIYDHRADAVDEGWGGQQGASDSVTWLGGYWFIHDGPLRPQPARARRQRYWSDLP